MSSAKMILRDDFSGDFFVLRRLHRVYFFFLERDECIDDRKRTIFNADYGKRRKYKSEIVWFLTLISKYNYEYGQRVTCGSMNIHFPVALFSLGLTLNIRIRSPPYE